MAFSGDGASKPPARSTGIPRGYYDIRPGMTFLWGRGIPWGMRPAWLALLGVFCSILGPGCGQKAPEALPPPAPQPCNGHVELCGRRFDQVSLPCTHNSMSNAFDRWVAPNQQFG